MCLVFSLLTLVFLFIVSESQTELVSTIQEIINNAYSDAVNNDQIDYKKTLDTFTPDSTDKLLQVEQNFHSVFSTIVWFLEQDPYTDVAMNLEVNYRKVKQENYKVPTPTGKDIENAIIEKDGNTFQNSQIHLLFYEKISAKNQSINAKVRSLDSPPQLSSMSWCNLKKNFQCNVDELAYDMELQLVMRDTTAQFVSQKQYEHLMFVLGQKPSNAPGQSCKDALTLFNDFPTNTDDNFKYMLYRLQLPFEYDDNKTLAKNRRDFKDFFSCLTNIRCAVVEGGHRCEAACRTLQGIQLGDHLPFEQKDIVLPKCSTIFKPVLTQVYYNQGEDRKLDKSVLIWLKKNKQNNCRAKKFDRSFELA